MLKLISTLFVKLHRRMKDLMGEENMYKSKADEINARARRHEYDLTNVSEAAEFLLDADKTRHVPVQIIALCKNLGFSVFVQKMPKEEICGYIRIDGELKDLFQTDRIISVNYNESAKRRRFTVAHELAHYLFEFDPEKNIHYYNAFELDHSANGDEQEEMANRFAAELLMPKKEFTAEYKAAKDSGHSFYDAVQSLSDTFLVPPKAVERRIKEELRLL